MTVIPLTMTSDAFNEITSSDGTFQAIAAVLAGDGAVVVGWTDGDGSHFDVLFVLSPTQLGPLQGGVSGPTDVFVGILRKGCFGFDAAKTDTHPGYLAEKLGLGDYRASSTIAKLTDLVNGVRAALQK